MAGRKPRRTRDEQAGVIPLHGVPVGPPAAPGSRVRRKRNPDPLSGVDPVTGEWEPQEGDWTQRGQQQRPPFPDGHKINQTHGMDDRQVVAMELIEPYLRSVLDDPKMPDHLRSPQFAGALQAWARAQFLADKAFAQIAPRSFGEMAEPLGRSGQGKSLLELWKILESMAARLRAELGMTPASYARLRASLGLAHQAEAEAMRKLADTGAKITARRLAVEAAKPLPAPLVPDDPEQAALIGEALVRQAQQRGER